MDDLTFAINLAREAGELLFNKYWQRRLAPKLKSDHSLVTEADEEADRLICERIRFTFPDDGIISEENHQLLDGEHEKVWIVDPLDGTANFINQVPVWGVSIARASRGELDLGVVYFPVTGELLSAERGKGVVLNGSALFVENDRIGSFFMHCSRTMRKFQVSVPYKARIPGSVAFNLASVAKGTAAINLEVAPKLWDVAAGWVIVKEAGGEIKVIAGEHPLPLKVGTNYEKLRFSYLAAGSAAEMVNAVGWIKAKEE